jgi:choline dehydrogenase-like flavoprotein
MLVDARTIDKNSVVPTDICIIGAGAAGITMAREFVGLRHKVILLESGGLEPDADTQSIYEGKSNGLDYALSDTRSRYFGGSTNQWWGNCRPLDDMDFEERSWIPHSGWPLNKCDLLPFYARAQKVCGLGSYENYDADTVRRCSSSLAPLSLDGERIVSKVIQTCPSLRFKDLYQDTLLSAHNIDTYLWGNATALNANESCARVDTLRVKCLSGNEFSIAARIFVLAAGGIENARVLLNSNKVQQNGLGNDHDLVGRFFMEHPTVYFSLNTSRPIRDFRFYDFYERRPVHDASVWGMLSVSSALIREHRLLGTCIYFLPADCEGIVSLREIKNALKNMTLPNKAMGHLRNVGRDSYGIAKFIFKRIILKDTRTIPTREAPVRMSPDNYFIATLFEQIPNPSNRVTLSSERDLLDQPRAELRLQLSPEERESYIRSLRILGMEIGLEFDPLELNVEDRGEDWRIGFFSHHIGTTRMSDDPKKGVVDRNCRVHGIANLFIAGSSVFPTGGSAAPTLTLVALAIRLADHLKAIVE